MRPVPSAVVLDTNVVSILLDSNSGPKGHYYSGKIAGRLPVVSFQTVEELWFGAVKAKWGQKNKNRLKKHLDQYAVVWPTPEMVDVSAQLRSDQEGLGRRLSTADAWIAATALMLESALASDDGDFNDVPNLTLIHYPNR